MTRVASAALFACLVAIANGSEYRNKCRDKDDCPLFAKQAEDNGAVRANFSGGAI